MDRRCVVLAAGLLALTGCGGHHRTGRSQVVSVPWQLVKAQGRHLRITSAGGGCQTFDHTGVRESARVVQVAVYDKVYVPGSGEACPANAVLYRLTITLRRALDGRSLLHAPVARTPR